MGRYPPYRGDGSDDKAAITRSDRLSSVISASPKGSRLQSLLRATSPPFGLEPATRVASLEPLPQLGTQSHLVLGAPEVGMAAQDQRP